MTYNSTALRKELENFRLSTGKISKGINGVGDIWGDGNYALLHVQIGELAKNSKAVIESGERVCSSADRYFAVADEDV